MPKHHHGRYQQTSKSPKANFQRTRNSQGRTPTKPTGKPANLRLQIGSKSAMPNGEFRQ
jgi:hypothetical protein